MDKEVLSSSQDSNIRDLLVLSNPSNKKSTKIKQISRILDHPKNLDEILGMVKHTNSLLDIRALLVGRIG